MLFCRAHDDGDEVAVVAEATDNDHKEMNGDAPSAEIAVFQEDDGKGHEKKWSGTNPDIEAGKINRNQTPHNVVSRPCHRWPPLATAGHRHARTTLNSSLSPSIGLHTSLSCCMAVSAV